MRGDAEYALHFNEGDELSPAQAHYAKAQFELFEAWYADWSREMKPQQAQAGGLIAMRVVDLHTEGEPTRLIMAGGPDLGHGPLAERRQIFADRHDGFRTFALNEPRGFEAMVGALLCEPAAPDCSAGPIFFNNAGYLGMCGHATIGAAVTLAGMGQLSRGGTASRRRSGS